MHISPWRPMRLFGLGLFLLALSATTSLAQPPTPSAPPPRPGEARPASAPASTPDAAKPLPPAPSTPAASKTSLPPALQTPSAKTASPKAQPFFLVSVFETLVSWMEKVIFFPVFGFPLIVFFLAISSIFFTFHMRFVNLRGFWHSIQITSGKYDNPKDAGEITHFQALTSALSATVGLGNIAGVALAVGMGGPGAVFWMMFIAFFGMTMKFVECTVAQLYRKIDDQGHVRGGAMYYLSEGLKKQGLAGFGKFLSIFFAICIIGGAFGGGNMFQSNQSYELVATQIPFFKDNSWVYGVGLAVLVGLVILGGIKRIGTATSALVPFMIFLYIGAAFTIILMNLSRIPSVAAEVFSAAFQGQAVFGGVIGAMIMGFRRAVFSNEAGIGSSPIAHSAAKTNEPVREGMVGMLEPFIDTIVICFLSASVLLITAPENKPLQEMRAAQHRLYRANLDLAAAQKVAKPDAAAVAKAQASVSTATQAYKKTQQGSNLTSAAFGSVFSWFPILLTFIVFLFAYSTMISWCYYGEKGWEYLFGSSSIFLYRLLFLGAVVLGAVAKLGAVLDFSDMMVLACAFPNIVGCLLLRTEIRDALDQYWSRLKSGEAKKLS